MQIWCAAGVDLHGGKTPDGGSAIGGSVFYADSCRDVEEGVNRKEEPKASMVWIGSSTHSCSKVTVVDANYPQNILDCFVVCTSHLLCITPVPGASEADYQSDEVPVTEGTVMVPKVFSYGIVEWYIEPKGISLGIMLIYGRNMLFSFLTPCLTDHSFINPQFNIYYDPYIFVNSFLSQAHNTHKLTSCQCGWLHTLLGRASHQ